MNTIDIWLSLIGMGAITILTRAFFLIGGERVVLPTRVQQALRYAPAAALAAIILPDLLFWQNHIDISLNNHKLLASITAALFFIYKRNMLGMIAVGMVVYTLLRLNG